MTLISSHFRWIFMVLSYRSDFNVRRFKLRNHYIIERLKIMLWESDIQKIFWNSDRCDICIQTFVNNNKQIRVHQEILRKSHLEILDSICTFLRALIVEKKLFPKTRRWYRKNPGKIFQILLFRGFLGREIMKSCRLECRIPSYRQILNLAKCIG